MREVYYNYWPFQKLSKKILADWPKSESDLDFSDVHFLLNIQPQKASTRQMLNTVQFWYQCSPNRSIARDILPFLQLRHPDRRDTLVRRDEQYHGCQPMAWEDTAGSQASANMVSLQSRLLLPPPGMCVHMPALG